MFLIHIYITNIEINQEYEKEDCQFNLLYKSYQIFIP